MDINTVYNEDCITTMSRMDDEYVDLIITDPPYGTDYKSHKQNHDTRSGKTVKIERSEYFTHIKNDKFFPMEWLKDAYRVLKDKSAIYIYCHWKKQNDVICSVESVGFKVKNVIILRKSNHGMGDLTGAYAPTYESLVYAVKGRHKLHRRLNDVWEVPVLYSGSLRFHPNEKPLSWMEPAILNSSDPEGIVYDPFCGSGSTLICCKDHNREFIGSEIDFDHYNTTLKRLDGKLSRRSLSMAI